MQLMNMWRQAMKREAEEPGALPSQRIVVDQLYSITFKVIGEKGEAALVVTPQRQEINDLLSPFISSDAPALPMGHAPLFPADDGGDGEERIKWGGEDE